MYCTGQSELKGEDVLFVKHNRRWPGSQPDDSDVRPQTPGSQVEHSAGPTAPLDGSAVTSPVTPSDWLAQRFPPCCPACGADTSLYSFFCVFDGHNGAAAAQLCGEAVLPLLEARLPPGCPPPAMHPLYPAWREALQLALVETVLALNAEFAQRGTAAGATATLLLQHGSLLTAANLGDSRALLDTGADLVPLTAEHRVASNKAERRRLEAMGALVAPVCMSGVGPAADYQSGAGPLRVWPGGLCLSRAVGDFDVGQSVLPLPHVTQVQLGPAGGRVVIASDGLWDAFDRVARVGAMSRAWPTEAAPSRLIQSVVRAHGGLRDDTTLVVVDVLPEGRTFAEVAAAARKAGALVPARRDGSGGGPASPTGGAMCSCFGSPMQESTLSAHLDASNSRSAVSGELTGGATAAAGGGKGGAQVLANVDSAAVVGLMPGTPAVEPPAWYTESTGERLLASVEASATAWQRARSGNHVYRPTAAVAGRVPVTQLRVPLIAVPAQGSSGGSEEHASQRFGYAVADDDEGGFATKFGHYGTGAGAVPSISGGAASLTRRILDNAEGSVRLGAAPGARGARLAGDPSVRIAGSALEGSVHLRASELRGGADAELLPPVRVVQRAGVASFA